MRPSLAAVVCLAATFLLAPPAAAAAPPRHTKTTAERNVIAAPRVLARWGVGLVDPRTRLVRNSVWVDCTGRGRFAGGGFPRFRCIVGYRRLRVSVTYRAQRGNGFELRDRRVYRV